MLGDSAKKILQFYVRSVANPKWGRPVAYFPFKSSSSLRVFGKVLDVLTALDTAGFGVHTLVTDGAAENRSFMRNLDWDRAGAYYYMYHPATNQRVVIIPDPPHVQKKLRNPLLKRALWLMLDGNEVSVDMDHIRRLVAWDRETNVPRVLHKLSKEALHPDTWQKMRVKLACVVLSQSVANMLRVWARLDKKPEVLGTALYCEQCNALFDLATQERAVTEYTFPAWSKKVRNLLAWFEAANRSAQAKRQRDFDTTKTKAELEGTPVPNWSDIPSQWLPPTLCEDLVQLCNGIVAAVGHYVNTHGVTGIAPGIISQDPVSIRACPPSPPPPPPPRLPPIALAFAHPPAPACTHTHTHPSARPAQLECWFGRVRAHGRTNTNPTVLGYSAAMGGILSTMEGGTVDYANPRGNVAR